VRRPALQRDEERLLDRLLGELEVAQRPREGGDRPSRLAAEQAVDGERDVAQEAACAVSGTGEPSSLKAMTGRTSMRPVAAPGIRAAKSSASSSDDASSR
jgi:hypothetical protein